MALLEKEFELLAPAAAGPETMGVGQAWTWSRRWWWGQRERRCPVHQCGGDLVATSGIRDGGSVLAWSRQTFF